MHKLTKAILPAMLASVATAQGALATFNQGGNQGNEGNNVFLDLVVTNTITISDINFRAGNSATNGIGTINTGSMNVYLGPTTWVNNTTNVGLWTLVTSTVVGNITHNGTADNPGILSPGVLTTPITLGPGSYGIALESQSGTWNHNYTNGTAGSNGLIASNADFAIYGGGATNTPWSAPTFIPRVANVEFVYTLGGSPIAVASTEQYGEGCYAYNTSFHEIFPNPASVDVANTSIHFTFAGGSYIVSTGTNPYVGPSAAALPVVLTTGDEHVNLSTVLGAPMIPFLYPQAGSVQLANDLIICTDGYITPDTSIVTQLVDSTPTTPEFYADGERWCPHWKNMNATLGGMTVEDTGTSYIIAWNAVADPNGATASTSSFEVEFWYGGATPGDVEYRYGAMSLLGGGSFPAIIGWTQGNAALPNAVDVSTVSLTTDPVDNAPLDIILDARPVLGTSPNFVVSGYDTATLAGIKILSFTQINPGLDLAALGMAGCRQYVGSDSLGVFFTAPGQTSLPFITGGIPNSASLNNVLVFAQAATFTSGFNPTGVIASNGIRVLLGSL
jgi:hypothetical protein